MKNSESLNIFIVDDDKMLLQALKQEIEAGLLKFNLQISTFETGEACQLDLYKKPDVAIIDYNLDSKVKDAMNGVEILDMIKKESPNTEVIMFTGVETAEIAVTAMHHGAHDYVVKNENVFRKLNISILQCYKIKQLKADMKRQKTLGLVGLVVVSIAIGIAVAVQLFAPWVFDRFTQ